MHEAGSRQLNSLFDNECLVTFSFLRVAAATVGAGDEVAGGVSD
jgi:hypothetical protein